MTWLRRPGLWCALHGESLLEGGLSHVAALYEPATLRAPIAGVATQVSSIQMGRYLPAGTAVFSIVDTQHPWVDANLKETE